MSAVTFEIPNLAIVIKSNTGQENYVTREVLTYVKIPSVCITSNKIVCLCFSLKVLYCFNVVFFYMLPQLKYCSIMPRNFCTFQVKLSLKLIQAISHHLYSQYFGYSVGYSDKLWALHFFSITFLLDAEKYFNLEILMIGMKSICFTDTKDIIIKTK